MPTSQVVSELTQVSGIGNWTAEIYAMFSLGRADVFAPGDLALQEATRLFNLQNAQVKGIKIYGQRLVALASRCG